MIVHSQTIQIFPFKRHFFEVTLPLVLYNTTSYDPRTKDTCINEKIDMNARLLQQIMDKQRLDSDSR